MKTIKYILRFLSSPLPIIYGIIIGIAYTFLPILPMVTGISLMGVISHPFIWVLNKFSCNLNYIEPFFGNPFETRPYIIFLYNLLGVFIYVLIIPFICYNWYRYGNLKVFVNEK